VNLDALKSWWLKRTTDENGQRTALFPWGSDTRLPKPSTTPKTDSERKEILNRRIIKDVANGFRLEAQTDFQAVLGYGKNANHILHLLLSLLTFGFWIIVWIIAAISSRKKTIILSIDEFGNAHYENQ
jgi:hypothetical protein